MSKLNSLGTGEKLEGKQTEAFKFNALAEKWNDRTPAVNYDIAGHFIRRLGIHSGSAVLDVACGTGILYKTLKDIELSRYTGIDISPKMAEEFLRAFPEADVRCADFESEPVPEGLFDYVVIFNSIPHFNDLNSVFRNACKYLKQGGKFAIAHARTRQGLKDHHKNIGYVCRKLDPIPEDAALLALAFQYGFYNIETDDTEYFFFRCERV